MSSFVRRGRAIPGLSAFFVLSATPALAEPVLRATGALPPTCSEMEVWSPTDGMCEPYPMEDMTMRMLMVHGNLFGTRVWQQGPRAHDAWASPQMVMADLGSGVGAHHYLNVGAMLTAERWTFPSGGYPLLMQIGEENQQGQPFVDAQHPHSSPIMGLTFSDTISFGAEKDYLKLSFAPRGEATDGPIAFMHRETGAVNPDAPLGHHIGQDVGHITSTVLAGELRLGGTRFQLSGYHGAEPAPEKVDLPIGAPDSVSLRVIQDLTPNLLAMVSFARVNAPEPDQPLVSFENRYSTSVYWQGPAFGNWCFYNALIYGAVTQYDRAAALSSFAEEFLLKGNGPRIWGRLEALQRTGAELQLSSLPSGNAGSAGASGEWVGEATLGYTHRLIAREGAELGLGGSATKDFLPGDFIGAYGGNPWAGKVFVELSGMHMWDL